MPVQYTMPPDTRAAGTGDPPNDVDNLIRAANAGGAAFNVLNAAYAGGADPTGAADSTAAVNAAETAAAAVGGILFWPPGTYKVSGLVKKNTTWQGAGRRATVVQLANAVNAPILVSDQFAAQTLTGSSTTGVSQFAIRDMTFDGNAAGQSVPAAAAVQIFGCDYLIENVSIRNFLAVDGLYTEFGPTGGSASSPSADASMEAMYRFLRIHDNTLTGAGWHDRGPHDSNVFGCWIYNNTTSSYGYWAETTFSTYTATGLNGTAVSSTPGTITVNTTLNLPAAGSATIPSAGGTVTLTWTGTTATTLTGAGHTGGSGNYTSNTLTPVCLFSAAANVIYGMHVWGNHSIAWVLDAEVFCTACEAEGAATGQVLVRSGGAWAGGKIFNPAGNTSYGIQYGDTVNSCIGYVTASPRITGFQGAAASKAYISIVNEAQSRCEALLTLSGTAQAVFGTFATSAYHRVIFEGGGSTTPGVAAAAGAGTGPPTPTVSNADDRCAQVSWGTGTTPAAGAQVTVTFAQLKPRTPAIAIWPLNSATALLQPYLTNFSGTSFQVALATAPAASQSAGTYQVGFADVTG